MNYRLQHKVRGSTGSWGAPLGAFQQSNQKRTTYLLQNRTFLFVANIILLFHNPPPRCLFYPCSIPAVFHHESPEEIAP